MSTNPLPDALRVLAEVARAFDTLGIAYLVGGSVASSTHGDFRATQDVDMVAELQNAHVNALVQELGADYYADPDMMRGAIAARSCFNLIQIPLGIKVDVFIADGSPFAREEMRRRLRLPVFGADTEPVCIASAEDIALQKLRWYRMTGERSDRQWNDVQGVLRVQANALDIAYMGQWAGEIGVADLLTRALDDAGLADILPTLP